MKVLFVLVLVCITSSIFAQSKKDQIAALTLRLDSLSREYVKDTAQLNHTVESLERKNSVLSGQNKAAQEQNKKKSQAIRDKTETIKTVNASNLDLMQERKELQKEINSLNDSIRMLKKKNSLINMKKVEFPESLAGHYWAADCADETAKYFVSFEQRGVPTEEGKRDALFIDGYEWGGEVVRVEADANNTLYKMYYLMYPRWGGGLHMEVFELRKDKIIWGEAELRLCK